MAAALGAAVGLLVEVVAQPILHLHDVHGVSIPVDVRWWRFIVVPLMTGAALGASAALATLPVAFFGRSRLGRGVAAAWVASALTVALAIHTLGLVVRYGAGVYPTAAAVELALASPVHFLDQARESFPHGLEKLALASSLVALVIARLLSRIWQRGPLRVARGVCLASIGGVAFLGSQAILVALADEGIESTETALYLSFLESMEEESIATDAPTGIEGPPVRAGAAYRAELARIAREEEGAFPNVILLVLESVPERHTGFGGYARPVTPNLDRIAAESLRMRRAWTTSTHSNYAQMAILSSLLPRRRTSLDTYRRLDYPRTLPQDLLRPLGYDTATISSQNENWQGMRRFQTTRTRHYFFDSHDYDGPKIGTSRDAKLFDETTIDEAIDWIDRSRSGPFYLYVNLQATHYSYHRPPGDRARFPAPSIHELRGQGYTVSYMDIDEGALPAMRDHYDSALHYQDAQIGRLVEALRERQLYDDTLLVITADHGESFGEAGVVTHGKTLREPEARPLLLLRLPGRLAPRDDFTPVSHIDLMPTVVDLLGLPPYPGYQGRSFADAAAHAREHRGVFLTMQGIRYMDALVCYPWKLVDNRTGRSVQLFNLAHDPAERRDLSALRPRLKRAMKHVLDAQIQAQLHYHRVSKLSRDAHYQPRVLRCPELGR